MQSFTVVLDACVLVPITAADTLLRLAEREMYRPVWSERILEEAKRAIARLHPELSAVQIDHRFVSMNRAFEDASVSGWVSLEGSIVLPDEDDRHVVACALAAGADAIVTNNVRDFPETTLAPLSIEVITLDDFLLDIFDLAPEEFAAVIREQVADAKHPSLSPKDVLRNLAAAGAPEAAAQLRPFFSEADISTPGTARPWASPAPGMIVKADDDGSSCQLWRCRELATLRLQAVQTPSQSRT